MLRPKVFAFAALILALAAAPAFAADEQHDQHHPGGPPPTTAAMPGTGQGMPGSGMMAGMGAGGMPMMGMMRTMEGHVEGRIAFLKTELKITDAQLPLWNAVADAIRASGKTGMGMMDGMGMGMMDGMGMGMMGQGGKLPERLTAREKTMTERLGALRKLKTAVDPLYAALSDEQKKTADELLISPMGMM